MENNYSLQKKGQHLKAMGPGSARDYQGQYKGAGAELVCSLGKLSALGSFHYMHLKSTAGLILQCPLFSDSEPIIPHRLKF